MIEMGMQQQTYNAIARFVAQESGIKLSDGKAYMVESRLTPVMSEFGISSFEHLATQLMAATGELRQAVVDAMTTNESFFFRDRTPFDLFSKVMLPRIAKEKRAMGQPLRIWCAAAATGQEPYSLAISVLENQILLDGLDFSILATDISQAALATAESGLYTQFEVQRGLSAQRMITHFEQDGAAWRVKPHLRDLIEFKELNLLKSLHQVGKVDIVFCRNVLIYFDVETKAQVLGNIRKQMNNAGYLMLGAAETLVGVTDHFLPTAEHQNLFQPTN